MACSFNGLRNFFIKCFYYITKCPNVWHGISSGNMFYFFLFFFEDFSELFTDPSIFLIKDLILNASINLFFGLVKQFKKIFILTYFFMWLKFSYTYLWMVWYLKLFLDVILFFHSLIKPLSYIGNIDQYHFLDYCYFFHFYKFEQINM